MNKKAKIMLDQAEQKIYEERNINVNIRMYIYDQLRMYTFAIPRLG